MFDRVPNIPYGNFLCFQSREVILFFLQYQATITFEVMYCESWPRDLTFESFHPVEEKMRVLEDWELESRMSGRSKTSLANSLKRKLGSLTSFTSSKKVALMEMGLMSGPFGDLGEDKAENAKKKKSGKEKTKEKERL